ncbi:hypothetical protein KFL01_03460 [Kocuria flava]|uniref:Uncharacterized protein n=1 Tax=Kocuria flava TaxID=446860 RepID=A0ABQ0X143_9MICC|nr:hypothetical protein KFL01_03460 [Kocuria flava]
MARLRGALPVRHGARRTAGAPPPGHNECRRLPPPPHRMLRFFPPEVLVHAALPRTPARPGGAR